jgi:hypothetical protein
VVHCISKLYLDVGLPHIELTKTTVLFVHSTDDLQQHDTSFCSLTKLGQRIRIRRPRCIICYPMALSIRIRRFLEQQRILLRRMQLLEGHGWLWVLNIVRVLHLHQRAGSFANYRHVVLSGSSHLPSPSTEQSTTATTAPSPARGYPTTPR